MKKKYDLESIRDFTLIIVSIIVIGVFLTNLDYILKPQNNSKVQVSDEKEKRNLQNEIPEMQATKNGVQVQNSNKTQPASGVVVNHSKEPTKSRTFETKITKAQEEKEKKEQYVKAGGKVGETKYDKSPSKNSSEVKALRNSSDKQVALIAKEQNRQEEKKKIEEQMQIQRQEELERERKIEEENKRLQKDLGYLNEGERRYEGGTPRSGDVKIEDGKKWVYIADYGWLQWYLAGTEQIEGKGIHTEAGDIIIGY